MSTGKEKYQSLKEYASEVDMELHRVAYLYIKQIHAYEQLSILQSIVDFNVVFIYNISPEVILHIESIEWLNKHLKSVKRKLTLSELLNYDLIIKWRNPENIEEFKVFLEKQKNNKEYSFSRKIEININNLKNKKPHVSDKKNNNQGE